MILVVIVLAALAAMLAGRQTPAGRVLVLLGQSVLVAVAAWMVLGLLMFLGVIPGGLVPPILAGVVFAFAFWARRARR